jgi:hypothetical protein
MKKHIYIYASLLVLLNIKVAIAKNKPSTLDELEGQKTCQWLDIPCKAWDRWYNTPSGNNVGDKPITEYNVWTDDLKGCKRILKTREVSPQYLCRKNINGNRGGGK